MRRPTTRLDSLRGPRPAAAAGIVVASLLGLYALHALSPLRLDSDSTEYFVIAAWIVDGHGIPLDASFPPGLPVLFAGLETLDLARSWAIVLANLVFLVVGLAATRSLLRRELGYSSLAIAGVCVATLLSFPLIRTASHPLSDIPFFGLGLSAVALAAAARARRSYPLLAGAAALALVATTVRTIGIALLPALFVALPTRRSRALVGALLAAVVAIAFAAGVAPSRYRSEALDEWRGEPASTFASHLWQLLTAFGELAANAPRERVPDDIQAFYPLVGLLALVPIALGAWRRRRDAPVATTFVATVAAVLVAWPFVDARLLIPVVPLLVAFAVEGLRSLPWRPVSLGGLAWAATFVAAGLVVLAVSLRITFSGDRFPEEYNANLRPTYRLAWRTAEPGGVVSARSLWALRRYEPRAVGEPGPTPRP